MANIAKQYQRLLSKRLFPTFNTLQRNRTWGPINTVVLFVPQQEAWVIERFGKYKRTLQPGFNICLPFIDRIKYVQSLKEIVIDIPQQSAISKDNVTLTIDGVLFLRVLDPYKASYGVEDAEHAIVQLAQTTMRSEIGKIDLDKVFRERENLNVAIVSQINQASGVWGIDCKRYEIRDIKLPERIRDAMQMQVEAERQKRATILESEEKDTPPLLVSRAFVPPNNTVMLIGRRESEINIAEGEKRAKVLQSEAIMIENINKAKGEAQAILARADAQATALHKVGSALNDEDGSGAKAGSLLVAQDYVSAFKNLAKSTNTVLLPSNAGDVSSMVAQALSVYGTVAKNEVFEKRRFAKTGTEHKHKNNDDDD